ncbi:MAG: AAA family ATPase [Bacteroidales bacterium]|nr:AAA family ATPase [Bacteroidales bacterium]
MYIRKQDFNGLGKESTFLWGARQTGKSTLLKNLFPDATYFDLLLAGEYDRFLRNPSLLREILVTTGFSNPVIIDEIQRIPSLLNEIHWLIVNKNTQFILSGSSPRNILRSGGNLLGGRALRHELYPLISAEIPDFDLVKALNGGLLPRHYQAANPHKLLSAYIGSYLRDEILTEAKIRNITSFSRFLEAAAFSNGEMVNYSNIAAECGVSSPTVKEYFQILEDTMTGRFLQSYQKKPKRRVILAPKFYYFDIGVANFLLKRGRIEQGSEAFGKAFEHFIYQELYAHSHYSDINYPISYWHTASQLEVDFILGDHEVAVETKSTSMVNPRHLKGLKSFAEEYKVKKSIIVSTDPYPRQIDNITVLPWQVFLNSLWAGEFIGT